MEVLKIYQMELQARITESKVSELLPAQQEKNDDKTCKTRVERPDGDDSGRSGHDSNTALSKEVGTKRELALSGSNPRTGDLVPIPERNNVDLRRSWKAAFPDSLLSLNFPALLVDDGTGPFLLEAL